MIECENVVKSHVDTILIDARAEMAWNWMEKQGMLRWPYHFETDRLRPDQAMKKEHKTSQNNNPKSICVGKEVAA